MASVQILCTLIYWLLEGDRWIYGGILSCEPLLTYYVIALKTLLGHSMIVWWNGRMDRERDL